MATTNHEAASCLTCNPSRSDTYDTYVSADEAGRDALLTAATEAHMKAAYRYADIQMAIVTHRIRQHYPAAGRLTFHVDACEIYDISDPDGVVIADPDAVEDFEHAPASPTGVDWEATLTDVCDGIAAAWEVAGSAYFTADGGYLDYVMPPA
jgi:hypothetical protein